MIATDLGVRNAGEDRELIAQIFQDLQVLTGRIIAP